MIFFSKGEFIKRKKLTRETKTKRTNREEGKKNKTDKQNCQPMLAHMKWKKVGLGPGAV